MKKLILYSTIFSAILITKISTGQESHTKLYQDLLTSHDSLKSKIYSDLALYYNDSAGNKSLFFSEKSLQYAETYKNKNDIVIALNSIAMAYIAKSDWNNALTFLNKALKEAVILNNPENLHKIYNQLGMVYKYSGQIDLSFQSYAKALNYANKIEDSYQVIFTINNIGNLFLVQKNYETALQYFYSAEKEAKKTGSNNTTLATIYNNIGYANFMLKKYPESKAIWTEALSILNPKEDYYSVAVLLNNLAEVEILNGNYEQAEINIMRADSLHNANNYRDSRKNLYFTAYQLYNNTKNYKKASEYLYKYIMLKDSIYTDELNSSISKLKTENEFVKLENASLIKDHEINSKNRTNQILLLVLLLITIIIVLLFNYIHRSSRFNKELKKLNKILEVKNAEIHSNLQYAKHIQSSLSSVSTVIQSPIILDLPKQAVGGDFYMGREYFGTKLYILGDCTGHGTTGSLLSVFAISNIDQILVQNQEINNIVKQLNDRFLNYITKSDNLKGESLSITIVQIYENKINFSGSKHKLWKYDHLDNKIIEYKTDPFIIGEIENQNYSLFQEELKAGDILFLSSDGYPDQFGCNEKGKFKYSQFREMLQNWATNNILSLEYPQQALGEWQGSTEQTDDILVIAIKN